MAQMWLAFGAIFVGFVGLIWSADRFVAGSAAIARNLGVTPIIIGLTIVSLGTSAPEIIVAISAGLKQAGDLAIGNALGSNLANIGLVLAITALVAPLPIQKHLLTEEVPILLGVTLLAGILLYDAKLEVWEGALLLATLTPLMLFLIKVKKGQLTPEEEKAESADIPTMPNKTAGFWFAFGLCILIGSSEILVWGAKTVALEFGVSPLIIGLTVIAVGTSLPELAASIMSALKGHHDIALGNIIGSNIFNLLAVMSMPGIISPPTMEPAVFTRDYMAMAAVTLILAIAIYTGYLLRKRNDNGTQARLGRRIGIILLVSYIAYYILLFSP